ncbi:MDR family MFS transporter [Catenuloplanes indicus]|uniref:EmrB/QacA subfamily drug resistance transporter n=1 Tax=Catenuloplanes indicus TaxID=137267 RepID=A0AAE4AWE0_9ACTN|nr:MDR family MFS transporter [Catenuloplanes indicus]MDQ0365865.1 EmrB/QacA subfamily drug resistance transporter [Catenuloplanes indicus]
MTTAPPGPVAKTGDVPAPRMTKRQINEALTGLMMGIFVSILASTVVANALPRVISDLGGGQSVYTWVVTAELLAMTATVPLWGKLADLYNQKLLIQASLGLFVAGSLLAGFAPNPEVLIASRVVQGIGAGGLTALVQVVMAAIIPPRELGRYSGIFGAVFATGTVAGPLIGGLLVDTDWLGWRWTFYFGVPFALLAIFLLQKTLRLPTIGRQVKVDYLGAFLIMAGVSTLLIWVTLAGNNFEWLSAWTAGLVTGGLALIALALVVEARVAEPIIPLGIFRSRTVSLATLGSLLVGVAMFGSTVFLSQYFQLSLGKSPTEAGLLSLPMIFGLMISSTIAGAMITKTGKWKMYLVAGAIIMIAGLGLLSTIGADTSLWVLGAEMAVLGIGVGLLMQNLVLAAQNDVPAHELGAATSVISFFRSLGGSVGVSVLGAILANRVTANMEDALGPAAAAAPGGGGHSAVPDLSTLPPQLVTVIQNAYGDAIGDLFLVAVPFAVLTLLTVIFIKEVPLKTTSGLDRLAEEGNTTPAPPSMTH